MAQKARYWFPAALSLLLVGWGANQYVALLVHYRQEHGFSEVLVTSLLGIYVLGLVPALLLGGRASDLRGRKRLTMVAVLISIAASLALMLSHLGPLPLFAGRLLAGTATGLGMAAATSWVKELSQAPWDPTSAAGSGARRASLLTSTGFCLGPVAGGLLVAWAPMPDILPYATHILLCLPVLFLLRRLPETRQRQIPQAKVPGTQTRPVSGGAVQQTGGKRFWAVIAPAAPWVFAAATMGFVVIPQMVPAMGGEARHAYTTVAVALTMGCGVLVQPLGRRVDTVNSARTLLLGVGVVLGGMLAIIAAILLNSPAAGLAASVLLGCGNGLLMVGGLLELQRAAGPDELGLLTGFFYTFAYAGFLAPTVIALVAQWVGSLWIMGAVVVLCSLSLAIVAVNSRKHLPCTLERIGSGAALAARDGS